MTKIYHNPLRTTVPVTRVNDSVHMTAEQMAIFHRHQHEFANKNYKHPDILSHSKNAIPRFDDDFLSQSFVYLITETVGDYPYPYFSEKTWKAMLSSVPFMLVGPRHSLQKLREFGFQTFDRWWDEEYDNCKYVADRIQLITRELGKLCELDYSKLAQLRQQMQSVVDHNRLHVSAFQDNDLKNIQTVLQSDQ